MLLALAPEDLESTILKKRSEATFSHGQFAERTVGAFHVRQLFPDFWFKTRGTRTVQ
jgi:hypothetical protein